jgi:hypothetical protein
MRRRILEGGYFGVLVGGRKKKTEVWCQYASALLRYDALSLCCPTLAIFGLGGVVRGRLLGEAPHLPTAPSKLISIYETDSITRKQKRPTTNMQRLSVKLGRLRKKPSQDKIAAAKTGADGVEAFKEVACSGWLLKTGGKGHTIRNTKKRFFVLRGVFLSYYTEDPIKSSRKDREILKGQLYLVDCVVSEVINNNSNAPSSSASDSPRSDNNGESPRHNNAHAYFKLKSRA